MQDLNTVNVLSSLTALFLSCPLSSFHIFAVNTTYSFGCSSSSTSALSLHPPSPCLLASHIQNYSLGTNGEGIFSFLWLNYSLLSSILWTSGLAFTGLLTGGETLTKKQKLINCKALGICTTSLSNFFPSCA